MQLFPDQEAVFYDDGGLYPLIEEGAKKILLVAPCGFGKTVCASHLMRDAFEAGKRVLFLCHLDQLRRQTAEKLESYGVPESAVTVIGGGNKADMSRPICVTSVQTVARRKDLLQTFRWDVILLDEAHQTSSVKAVQPAFADVEQLVIGLTATPYRLKRTESMADWFTHMVCGLTPAELVEKGRLAPLKYFGFTTEGTIDTSRIHTRAGDFDNSELSQECSRPELLIHAVKQWERLAKGKRTLVFGCSVMHAEDLCRAFVEHGVPAAVVTGETPPEKRQELFRQLHALELQILVSIQVLSIGFDLPSAECLLLAAPTKSRARHLQRLGRGARVWEEGGKTHCVVIDQGGDLLRHAGLEQDGPWQLVPAAEAGPAGGGTAPFRICPDCQHVMPAQFTKCPECGAEQPRTERQNRVDDLKELVFNKAERKRKEQLHRWIRKARDSGYLQGWVVKQWERKYPGQGHPPAELWRGALYGDDPRPQDAARDLATTWGKICARKNRGWGSALTALVREFGPELVESLSEFVELTDKTVWEDQEGDFWGPPLSLRQYWQFAFEQYSQDVAA